MRVTLRTRTGRAPGRSTRSCRARRRGGSRPDRPAGQADPGGVMWSVRLILRDHRRSVGIRAWGRHPIPQGPPRRPIQAYVPAAPRRFVPVVPTVHARRAAGGRARAATCPRCGFPRAASDMRLAQPIGARARARRCGSRWLARGRPLYAGDPRRPHLGGVSLVAGGSPCRRPRPRARRVARARPLHRDRLGPRSADPAAAELHRLGAVSRVTKFGPVGTSSPRDGEEP